MKNKYLICTAAAVVIAVIIAAIGHGIGIWDFGFDPLTLIGLLAVVPSVVWIYKKGLNYINSGIYFAGIGYIMYKNLFDGFSGRFVVLCVLLVLLALVLPATASAFRKETAEEENLNEQERKEN